MDKKNVAVIFGGNSSEHEVSLNSAETVLSNISSEKYNVIMIGISRAGKWFQYFGEVSKIADGSWETDSENKVVYFSADSTLGGIIVLDSGEYKVVKIDVVIPVLHGKNGEDGTIQGLFKLAKIPFVGSSVLSSAMCMDKVITNTMLRNSGINQANFVHFYIDDYMKNQEFYCDLIENKIKKYPVFVKPANSGSSVGISKVYSREGITEAVIEASKEDEKITVEQFINGRELECAVIGNREPFASIVGEIISSGDFYDYDAKYMDTGSKLNIPAEIKPEISDKIRSTAIKAYKIMGCRGLARVDFFLENETEEIYVIEINTFPGFTDISMFPRLLVESGYSMSEIIDDMISFALDKNYRGRKF